MAVSSALPVGSPRWAWRARVERRPELPVLGISAAAWVVLLLVLRGTPTSSSGHDHGTSHLTTTGQPGDEWLSGAGRGALLWVVMTVAMMLPLAVPGLRYVARMVPRRGRLAATSTFASAYVVAWLPAAVLAGGVHPGTPPDWPVVAAVFLLAAGWELTPIKRAALLRGHRHHVVRAQQPARRRTCWSFGLRRGGWCLVSCGPAMLALMIGHHALVPLLVLAVGAVVQQLSPDAHWRRTWSAAGLVLLAVGAPWLI